MATKQGSMRPLNSTAEIFPDGKILVRGKEVFYKPKDNGYKELKTTSGSTVSGHLNSRGEIILREVSAKLRVRGSMERDNSVADEPIYGTPNHYELPKKSKEGLEEQIDGILRMVCRDRGISHLSITEKLVGGSSLLKWSPLALQYTLGEDPSYLKKSITKIINQYTPRIDSLSWEKQGEDRFVLYANLI